MQRQALMSVDQVIAFLVFSLVAAVTPGPSNLMITATGSSVGIVRGLPCVLGASLGMGLLLFCAALGLGQFVLGHPALLKAMNACGAAFLLWLDWKVATSPQASGPAAARPAGLIAAALFQWVNPKGWLVAVAAAGTYLQAGPGDPVATAAAFGALFFAAALPSGLLWLVLGALMQRLLQDHRRARIFRIAMGAALAVSVMMMAY
jgi:threonine/homoserine/homoserine lactone efflux protein